MVIGGFANSTTKSPARLVATSNSPAMPSPPFGFHTACPWRIFQPAELSDMSGEGRRAVAQPAIAAIAKISTRHRMLGRAHVGQRKARDDGPAFLKPDQKIKNFEAPADFEAAFEFAAENRDDRSRQIEARLGLHEEFDEMAGVEIFHKAPIDAHRFHDAFVVGAKMGFAAVHETFGNALRGEFAGPHRQINARGKNWVHETGRIPHAKEPRAGELAVMI